MFVKIFFDVFVLYCEAVFLQLFAGLVTHKGAHQVVLREDDFACKVGELFVLLLRFQLARLFLYFLRFCMQLLPNSLQFGCLLFLVG